MIVRSRAPLRLGLAGGGSDVAPYCDRFGGCVLNATLNLSAYCTLEEMPGDSFSILSHDSSFEGSFPLGQPLDTSGGAPLVKGVYNRILKDFGPVDKGFRITTYNDAPAGSGLGTSSTMVVCILQAFNCWLGLGLGKERLARLAFEIEREDLGFAGGKQDQWAAAYGGFNLMHFARDGAVEVEPLVLPREMVEELEASLLLYYTGRSRVGEAIIREQQRNTSAGKQEAIEAMHRIRQSSLEMRDALVLGDMRLFARILHACWEDKKKMASGITNPVIQEALDTAFAHGAIAGKVSGAGGGGFLMLVVEPERRTLLRKAMEALPGQVVPFRFTPEGAEARVVEDDAKVLTGWTR